MNWVFGLALRSFALGAAERFGQSCIAKRLSARPFQPSNALHPVQQAWLDLDVAQCGFCQPGQVMAAVDLLRRTKNPTDADIDAIENVCRCATYGRIRAAIKLAAQRMP